MLVLDARTLLVAGLFNYFLMGGLTLLAAWYGRRGYTLWWCALACVLGGLAYLLGLAVGPPYWGGPAIWWSNALLLSAYGCIWGSLRDFAGGRPLWAGMVAGGILWLVLCTWPTFRHSVEWRILAFSLIAIGYMVASSAALASEWRRERWAPRALLAILIAHGIFYVFRMLPRRPLGPTWVSQPDFTVTMLENILFIVSAAYGILVMVDARARRHYRDLARRDALTGLANRRRLFEWGERTLALARERREAVAALMCDLDQFKRVNDRHGHESGDRVLVDLAAAANSVLRDGDLCARIGGDEFVVLLRGAGCAAAERAAMDIRATFAARIAPPVGPLSVSIGLACTTPACRDLDELLSRADRALYEAKRAGRDCARVWRDSPARDDVAGRRRGA